MSLALSDLRIATRRYINETSTSNTHFTDSELNDYINQAVQFLAVEMEWNIQTDTAVAIQDQALYQLPTDFIELVDVYFNNTKMIILDRVDLGTVSPQWQNDPSGTPKICYRFDRNTIGVYNPPDSTQAGFLIQINYVRLPAELLTDTDIPDLHTAFQVCLPFYAAYICHHRLGNEKASDRNLQQFEIHRKKLMAIVDKFSDDTKRFRWAWNSTTSSNRNP